MRKYIGALSLVLLLGCQSEAATLNTEHLTVYENGIQSDEEQPTMYKANSVEEALKALPFTLTVPDDLPEAYGSFSEPLISDFNDPEDQKDIGISITASTNDRNEKTLSLFSSDFELVDFNHLIKQAEEVKLSGGDTVYYSPSAFPDEAFQTSSIYWMKEGLLHELSHTGHGDSPEQIKELLLDLVTQMQEGGESE